MSRDHPPRGRNGGFYDDLGFYNFPDGSFYDPQGRFFNKEGFDEEGGRYDENNNYVAPLRDGQGEEYDEDGDYGDEEGRSDDLFENDDLAKQFEAEDDLDDFESDPAQ
jgi:hypothetical protein